MKIEIESMEKKTMMIQKKMKKMKIKSMKKIILGQLVFLNEAEDEMAEGIKNYISPSSKAKLVGEKEQPISSLAVAMKNCQQFPKVMIWKVMTGNQNQKLFQKEQ